MKTTIQILAFVCSFGLASCSGFLDEKPNKSILVPETSAEYEALIDSYAVLNLSPIVPLILADDYWTTESNWQNYQAWQQNSYQWSPDPYLPDDISWDYMAMYRKVNIANVVLDKLKENPDWSVNDRNRLQGKALFWRAHAYFELAVLYLPLPGSPLDTDEYMVPVPSSADLNSFQEMSTASRVFAMVLEDLEDAIPLLLETTEYPTQPSRHAGYALLARIQLYLGNYPEAAASAEKVLDGQYSLLDYQELDSLATYPVTVFNSETILFTVMGVMSAVSGNNVAFVDTLLTEKYDSRDLRSKFLFENNHGYTSFKGTYSGNHQLFTGIALDEVYLILAESYTRIGDRLDAVEYFNNLMEKRYRNYVPIAAEEINLSVVMEERRKSLLFRGQRWADLKRESYNDGVLRTVVRSAGGKDITLVTNPENLVMRIPLRERTFIQ